MSRGLSRSLLLVPMAVLAAGQLRAAERETPSATSQILQRFLTIDAPAPTQYRALRHLDARTENLSSSAWMDVWTEADHKGFRYRIAAEGGSESIRSRVFGALLETERKAWTPGGRNGSAARSRHSDTSMTTSPTVSANIL